MQGSTLTCSLYSDPSRFTTHEAQGLTSGKTYSFRVIAENIYGRSDPSVESSPITTQETAKKKGDVKKYEGTTGA